jgi:hypothetical protein
MNEKNVCLVIKGGKMSAKCLAKAMKMFLDCNKKVIKKLSDPVQYKGKQSVKRLVRQGHGVTNIEISDKNIKSFESIARKYGVDFAVTKDTTEQPPKYLVFFKGRDTDAITAAFREYSAKQLSRSAEKPSMLGMLKDLMEKVKNQVLDLTKNKNRGQEI